MRFGSYECWLAFEDRPLDEYSIQIEGGEVGHPGPVLSKAFVLSEIGKPFHLNWRDHTARNTLLVTVRMDGKLVSRGIHAAGTSGKLRGVTTGLRTMRLFVFASSNPSRLFHNVPTSENHLDVGTIQVTMVPIRSIKSGPALGPGPVASHLPAISSMHYISLRQECVSSDSTTIGDSAHTLPLLPCPDIDIIVREMVVFEFRYRPLVHLQAMGIFPCSSSLPANSPSVSGSPPPDSESISSTEVASPFNSTLGKRSRQEYEDASMEDDGE